MSDVVVVPVDKKQYLLTHIYISKCWVKSKIDELEWFLASMRGELPPSRQPVKNYTIVHVFLPTHQYFLALESITANMGARRT